MFDIIGGRKFVGFVIAVVAGALTEIFGKGGLSTEMVALIGASYATFAATNTVITNKHANVEVEAVKPAASSPQPSAQDLGVQEAVAAQLSANNQQLADILNQIGRELANQQAANEKVLEALNSVQSGQATVQKGISILIGRGQS